METLSDIGLKIKQEPNEDSFCERELSKNNQGISTDSNHVVNVASVQEELRYKRKVVDETEQPSEKRRRSVSEASDVEIFGGDYGCEKAISDANPTSRNTNDGCGKFQCLLCDESFGTEDELMGHLSLIHKHNSQSRRQPSRFARHTCQICYARFRTLKDFFNHTSCHASHPNMSSIDRDISTRVSNNLSKNALQRYFLNVSNFSRELLQPTFKCDCCNTVFVNRDAYAMHVMMRVKNESCKVTCDDSFGEVMGLNAVNSANQENMKSPSAVPNASSDDSKLKPDLNCSPAELHQAFYVDVTSSADRDEYLQSVLEKSNNNTDSQQNSKLVLKDGRKCMLCQEIFTDQDALAMHVMSHHSNDLSSPTSSNESSNHYNSNKTPSPTPSHILKYFAPFANDRLLTLQTEILYCEYCGQSFVNRDTLAMHVLSHAHEQETSEGIGLNNALRMTAKTFESSDVANVQSVTENHMKVLRAHNEEPLNLMTTQRSRSMTQDFQRKESEKENNETCFLSSDNKNTNEFKKNKHEKIDKSSVESSKTNKNQGDNQSNKGQTDKQASGLSQTSADPKRERSASVPNTKEFNVEHAKRAASVGCLIENIEFSFKEKSVAESEVQPTEKGNSYSKLSETNKSNGELPRSDESKVVPPKNHRNKDIPPSLKRRTSEGNSLEDLLGFSKHKPILAVTDERPCPMALNEGKEPGKIEMLMKGKDIHVCKYCEIIFPSRTLYYLHMGLHNVNTPWQCNMCGKVCANVHDFNAHVIHL